MTTLRRRWSELRYPRLRFAIETYEAGRVDINPPTDPVLIACLSTPTLHRLVAGTTLPRAQLAINAELAARAAWRGPARWALGISATALLISIVGLLRTL